MPVVVIIDQETSRNDDDRIPDLVEELNVLGEPFVVMPFQRTIGDECQGVLDGIETLPAMIAHVARTGRWWTGIGVGEIDGIASDTRDVSGTAFARARDMVEDAKRRQRRTSAHERRSWPLRVAGAENAMLDDAIEACLASIHMIVSGRSTREHEVATLLQNGVDDQREVARLLHISQPAVSKAILRSHFDEEMALARAIRTIGSNIR